MFIKKVNLFLIMSVLVVTALCSTARAFYPDDQGINETLFEKYGPLTSYKALITFPDEPNITIQFVKNGIKWKQVFSNKDESGVSIKMESTGEDLTVLSTCPKGENLPLPIFSFWVPSSPVQSWVSLGVDNATKSYGFLDNVPVFIYGSNSSEATTPQVWFDNETFSPVKIILNNGSVLYFSDYGQFAGFMLPHKGIITNDGKSLEFKIKWSEIRSKFTEEEFYLSDNDSSCTAFDSEALDRLRDFLKIEQ